MMQIRLLPAMHIDPASHNPKAKVDVHAWFNVERQRIVDDDSTRRLNSHPRHSASSPANSSSSDASSP
jgi:hypothetical protein